jgi:hypothetical protein
MRLLRAFLVLGCAAVLVTGGAPAASAAATHERIPYEQTFLVTGTCVFTVEEHFTGTIVVNSTPQGEVQAFPRFTVTFTNLDTGASIGSPLPAVVRIVSNGDGTATVYVTGLQGHLAVPGEGLVAFDVGRIVFVVDEETGQQLGDFVFTAGQFSFGPYPALCDVLG